MVNQYRRTNETKHSLCNIDREYVVLLVVLVVPVVKVILSVVNGSVSSLQFDIHHITTGLVVMYKMKMIVCSRFVF